MLLLLALIALNGRADPALVGKWGLNGEVLFDLAADGTGTSAGDRIKWSADGKTLRISAEGETDQVPYRIEAGKMIIEMDGLSLALERVGGAPLAKEPQPPARIEPVAQNDQLSQLLLSSAWCSFSYSSASGTTRTTRVVFGRDGTWSLGGNRETQWSGPNGSYYGQNGSAGAGRWAVKNGQLFMSNPPETPELSPVVLTIKQNSSGYPIITADGTEYSMCK
jgi:hypothetical protein